MNDTGNTELEKRLAALFPSPVNLLENIGTKALLNAPSAEI